MQSRWELRPREGETVRTTERQVPVFAGRPVVNGPILHAIPYICEQLLNARKHYIQGRREYIIRNMEMIVYLIQHPV